MGVLGDICAGHIMLYAMGPEKQGEFMPKKQDMNDKLAQSFVTLTANLTRLSAAENLVVQGTLKELETEIVDRLQKNPDMGSWRKARYEALLSQTRNTIKENYNKISSQSAQSLQNTAEVATKATEKIFKGVGISLQSVVTTPEQWKALSTRSLIEGAPSAAWWSKQSKELQDAFVREMRMGYAQGETIDQLVQRVRGTATGKRNAYWVNGKKKMFVEFKGGIMDTGTRQAQALVRTSIMQVAADAKMEMFKMNADIIKGLMWNSTLDNRTTPVCRAHSGLLYSLDGKPIGHNVPFLGGPPVHWQCRSTLLPVTKSFEELGATPGITKEYLDEIGTATRASMTGAVPEELTFDTWFRTLPKDDQISMLGPKKYEIWKDAGLTFQEMVDQRGNPLTVEQLAKAYGFKIEQSKLSGIPNIPKKIVSAIAVEQQAQALASEMAKKEADARIAELAREDTQKWQDLKNTVDGKLSEDDTDISANMKNTALQRSENAPDGDKMAAYQSQLELLKSENARIEQDLKDIREKDAAYRELELEWRRDMRNKGRKIPYWDMVKYQQELNLYIIRKNRG